MALALVPRLSLQVCSPASTTILNHIQEWLVELDVSKLTCDTVLGCRRHSIVHTVVTLGTDANLPDDAVVSPADQSLATVNR